MSSDRCDDLWFEDGTVIIRAHERTDGQVVATKDFKVYRGLLERYSDGILGKESFRSIVPDENVDGCPILPLFDDSIADVTNFLKAIYCHE
jgi:hypothetical protein